MTYTLRNTGIYDRRDRLVKEPDWLLSFDAVVKLTDSPVDWSDKVRSARYKSLRGSIRDIMKTIPCIVDTCIRSVIVDVYKDDNIPCIEYAENTVFDSIYNMIEVPKYYKFEDEITYSVLGTRKYDDIKLVCQNATSLIYGEWKGQPELANKTNLVVFECSVDYENLSGFVEFLKLNKNLSILKVNILGEPTLAGVSEKVESLDIENTTFTFKIALRTIKIVTTYDF